MKQRYQTDVCERLDLAGLPHVRPWAIDTCGEANETRIDRHSGKHANGCSPPVLLLGWGSAAVAGASPQLGAGSGLGCHSISYLWCQVDEGAAQCSLNGGQVDFVHCAARTVGPRKGARAARLKEKKHQ